MKNDIYAEYQSSGRHLSEDRLKTERTKYKIIQIFSDIGGVSIGENDFPITYGGLYFVNSSQDFSINHGSAEDYLQNMVMISKNALDNVAKALDFEKVVQEIFEQKGGYYLQLDDHKIIDTRFEEIYRIYNANNYYAKASLLAKVLDLFSYAVASKLKK